MRETLVHNALQGWRELNAVINEMVEDELALAIKIEVKSDVPRNEILIRLHARFCKLRSQRERAELLENVV